MTKRGGRYYLQYSTPGTVTEWYCDTVMEGASPTGPFRHVPYAPASLKVGGFMGSADGYLVRFGDAPDRLCHSLQLQGGGVTSLVTHALNCGVRAAWRVDAFNANGATSGQTAWGVE
jgi:hypothetical protein